MDLNPINQVTFRELRINKIIQSLVVHSWAAHWIHTGSTLKRKAVQKYAWMFLQIRTPPGGVRKWC